MTIEQIDRLVRGANPVPDISALDPIEAPDLLSSDRSDDMETNVTVDKPDEDPKRWRPLVAFAAITIVALALGVVWLQNELGDTAAVPTPVETAEAFTQAFVDGDLETADALLADNAPLKWHAADEASQIGPLFRFIEAVEWQYDIDNCRELPSPGLDEGESLVLCDVAFNNMWSASQGDPPYEGSAVDMVIGDGEVTSANLSMNAVGFSAKYFEGFRHFVLDNYPEDAEIMYAVKYTRASLTDESIDLWRQHSEEFVATLD